MENTLISAVEAAELTGVRKNTILKWRQRGYLAGIWCELERKFKFESEEVLRCLTRRQHRRV